MTLLRILLPIYNKFTSFRIEVSSVELTLMTSEYFMLIAQARHLSLVRIPYQRRSI